MTLSRSLVLFPLLALAAGTAGCTEFFDLEEACHPENRVAGGGSLSDVEYEAMDRLNCYRRLSGLSRLSINTQVQLAAENVREYIQKNPDADRILAPNQYLRQVFDDEAYTGANATSRLEAAAYFFSDPGGTGISEILIYADNTDGTPALRGAEVIDRLMRVALFREHGLQPSWIDGAYVEIGLGPKWFTDAGVCRNAEAWGCNEKGEVPPDINARLYYLISVHGDPHLERAAQPFLFPKNDQKDVYQWSGGSDRDTIPKLGYAQRVEIGYPITLYGGVIDDTNYKSSNQNVFGIRLENTEIEGPGGTFIAAKGVLPGAAAEGRYPSGFGLRKTAVVYPREPLAPMSDYTLRTDVTTNEAEFSVAIDFSTGAEDVSTLFAPDPKAAARVYSATEVEAFLADRPHMVDPRRPRLTR